MENLKTQLGLFEGVFFLIGLLLIRKLALFRCRIKGLFDRKLPASVEYHRCKADVYYLLAEMDINTW